MKLHIVTVGKPKLAYAKLGWEEYLSRLHRLHSIRLTQLSDKFAYDAARFQEATTGTTTVALEIKGKNFSSSELAAFLEARELESREVSFIIGGPEGLPDSVRQSVHYQWSISSLTLPHDLAMVVTLEALYRASTINAHLPYHK